MFMGSKKWSTVQKLYLRLQRKWVQEQGIGIASAIFGIGGGSLTVPYLTHYGVVMQKAVGTSAAWWFTNCHSWRFRLYAIWYES